MDSTQRANEPEDDLSPAIPWDPQGNYETDGPVCRDAQIRGVVDDLDVWESAFGPYPVVTIRQPDGTRIRVQGWGAVLKGRLAELKPEVGEELTIAFLGMKKPAGTGRKAYANFEVRVTGRTKAMDWTRFGREAVADGYDSGPPIDEPTPEELRQIFRDELGGEAS